MELEFFVSSGRETSVSSGIVPRATPSLSIPLGEVGFPASLDKNPRFQIFENYIWNDIFPEYHRYLLRTDYQLKENSR